MNQEKTYVDVIEFFNECQHDSIKICYEYFSAHKFDYFNHRLLQFSADYTQVRFLRSTWIECFNLDSKKFLDFYEKVWQDREVPHYEDLILMTLISIITSVFANYLYDKIKELRIHNLQVSYKKIEESSKPLLIYLIKIYAVRDAYNRKILSDKQFKEIQNFLKTSSFNQDAYPIESDLKNLYKKIWFEFAQTHNINYNFYEEFQEFIENYSDKNKIREKNENFVVTQKFVLTGSREKDALETILGLGASKGIAEGILKICDSIRHVDSFYGGEIGFIPTPSPEYVEVLRKCSGVIGGHNAGGMTGHLAIVSRELDIPCTICHDDRGIYQYIGKIAIVDGDRGEISFYQ